MVNWGDHAMLVGGCDLFKKYACKLNVLSK